MHFTQIKETCLYTTELERAEKFYTEVLSLEKIGAVNGRHVFFRAGSSVLLIFNPEATAGETDLPPHDGYGRIHLAFEIASEEYEDCRKRIQDKGITILHDHELKEGRSSFYFHDPDGHLLEVIEPDVWK